MSFDHHLPGGSEAWEKALLIDDDISEPLTALSRADLHFEVVDFV